MELDADCLYCIYSFLPEETLFICACISRLFRDTLNNNLFWKERYLKLVPAKLAIGPESIHQGTMSFYRCRYYISGFKNLFSYGVHRFTDIRDPEHPYTMQCGRCDNVNHYTNCVKLRSKINYKNFKKQCRRHMRTQLLKKYKWTTVDERNTQSIKDNIYIQAQRLINNENRKRINQKIKNLS